MTDDSIKTLLYGGIKEMCKDTKYYYSSSFGPTHSYFTPEGTDALVTFVNLLMFKSKQCEAEHLNKLAKELVINGLKGEKL